MPAFQRKHWASTAEANAFGQRYRALMRRRPFLLFGLPFLTVIIAGSFVLTPATAVRYEKHDRKVRQMTREEELGMRKGARKVDLKDEYYVSPSCRSGDAIGQELTPEQRLAAKDLDDWEQ